MRVVRKSRGRFGGTVGGAAAAVAVAATTLVGAGLVGCENTPRLRERVFTERASYALVNDGDRALENDQPEMARAHYRAAIEQHPGNFEARKKLAEVLIDLGDPATAREHLEVVLTEKPDDEEVLDLMAIALAQTGDVEGMDRWIRSVAERTNEAQAWARLGNALALMGDADQAEGALKRAAAVDEGESLRYQLLLGDFYRALGNDGEALRRYRMALYIDVMNDHARAAIRDMGEIPGPSFTLRPAERPGS